MLRKLSDRQRIFPFSLWAWSVFGHCYSSFYILIYMSNWFHISYRNGRLFTPKLLATSDVLHRWCSKNDNTRIEYIKLQFLSLSLSVVCSAGIVRTLLGYWYDSDWNRRRWCRQCRYATWITQRTPGLTVHPLLIDRLNRVQLLHILESCIYLCLIVAYFRF